MFNNIFRLKFSAKRDDSNDIFVPGIDARGIKQAYRAKHLLITGGMGSGLHEHCFTALDRAIEHGCIIHYLTVADDLLSIVAQLYNRALEYERTKTIYSNTIGLMPHPHFNSISVKEVHENNGICLHAVPRDAKADADDFLKILDQLNTILRKDEKKCVVVIHGNAVLFTRLRESILALQDVKSVSVILLEHIFSSDSPISRKYQIFFEKGFAHMKLLGGTLGHDETEFAWIPNPLTSQRSQPIKLRYKSVKRPFSAPIFAN
jgi:hypothetical protein